jgi:hypothetical protein
MKKNIGNADRLIRVFVGLAAGVLGIVFNSWWGLLGLIPIATAVVGTCPVYLPLGVSTRGKA